MKVEEKVLFTNISKLSELKYFIGVIHFKEKSNENFVSDFNWQKIQTRCLLKEYDYILAAPVKGKLDQINIVISEEHSGKQELIDLMIHTKLTLMGPLVLNKDIYFACILYTLKYKMSPEWIEISQFFVKSPNFLASSEAIEAVKIHFLMSDSCLGFSIRALRLKLPFLSLDDLKVDVRELYKEGYSVIRQKVYVIPDFKLATAVGVYLNIPASCPFKNYNEIRSHWKTVYGLTLPKEEMIFIEVTFDWDNFAYLYPMVCVYLYEPIQMKSRNEIITINNFMETMKIKFSKICGHPIQINMMDENIFYPTSKLYLSSEVVNNPNLLKFVSEYKAPENFYKKNNNQLFSPAQAIERCSSSPTLFSSKLAKNMSPAQTFTSKENIFKCTPIFRPKMKNDFYRNKEFSKKNSKNSDLKTFFPLNNYRSAEFSMETTSKKFTSYEEVRNLARSRNLKKLTVPDLINFCRENSIPSKPKEKKEFLTQKIYDFFTSTGLCV